MNQMQRRKKKSRINALVYGAASVALYTAVFSFSGTIMSYVTKGGVWALAPVGAVFVFSWIHGNFASNVWTALGVEPSRSNVRQQAEKKKRADKEKGAKARIRA
ncbi:MAG: hypothetical protein ACLFT8_02700 [Desulfovermiculus sp.]